MKTAKQAPECILHAGIRQYKYKNSHFPFASSQETGKKGAIFAYRSKERMVHGRGVVLTSEEAIQENQDAFTHWTPNVYRYGTYADEKRSYTKGHSENNLRQINTFFIDFDIHTAKETIHSSDILTTAIDLGFMPTLILKSDKGYQAYFVLETPVYVTSKSGFRSVKAAKHISQNLREYFGQALPVDMTCNHFGIARMPRTDNVEFFEPSYRYSFKAWQEWSFKQADNNGVSRPNLTVLSGSEGKRQVDEPWFTLLLHETKFEGKKGLIGRNNVMFTLSLAYFSSGYSIETCEYNLFEFNNRLEQPLEEKEVIKLVKSAYSENYQAASREYITLLCKEWVSSDLTSKELFVRQGWVKFKKKRSERQRVHLAEWQTDFMAYISEKSAIDKPYLVTTKKEIREALGIPERTLDKLLKVLKAEQEIFFKIKSGRNGGIQIASVKSLLLSIIKVKQEKRESYIKALTASFNLERIVLQETLNKLAECPKMDTQLDLFSYDTG
ncbi:primase C-terminal domain-containing protein [Enterococcus dispar]